MLTVQAEGDIHLLFIAYDPLKEEIGSWNELGSSRASSYREYSDYESSRVNRQPDCAITPITVIIIIIICLFKKLIHFKYPWVYSSLGFKAKKLKSKLE